MQGLTIKHVADASGFTTSTLRYYEEIGLLLPTKRTAAGYRVYDEASIDRLAFIARAKQLGCSLADITALASIWEVGECGPVQDQLRIHITDRLDAARVQISELLAFTAELQHAGAVLERRRSSGGCDDGCGCMTDVDPSSGAASIPVTLGKRPDIACTLPSSAMRGRVEDWNALLAHAVHREPLDEGVRVLFGPDVPTDELMRLVVAEQSCCQFFEFAVTVDRRGVALEVRGPSDAGPIVTAVFGVAP